MANTTSLPTVVAQEILAGFEQHPANRWCIDESGAERPVVFEVQSPSLEGMDVTDLDKGIEGSFSAKVSYDDEVRLRRVGVIARLLLEGGVYTGVVSVQEACDDFDL